MAKYRKIPLVIDAEQWFPFEKVDGVINQVEYSRLNPNEPTIFGIIKTLEEEIRVNEGDWVITSTKGEKYSCRDKLFQELYEPYEYEGK